MEEKAKVYRWTQYLIETDTILASRRLGTPAAIASLLSCSPILETEQEVALSSLDYEGFVKETP